MADKSAILQHAIYLVDECQAGAFSEADLRATRFEKQQSLLRTFERG